MKRDVYQKLVDWRNSPTRKPLLLKGARQTGKTYILKEFGGREYDHVVYCNFEEDPSLEGFFSGGLEPSRILSLLSTYTKHTIRPGRDLVIFDEIQASNDALASLKYFDEEASDFHVAAAGSLLGVKLSVPKSFPVGKVDFLDLHPMTFLEFLDALENTSYREFLEGLTEVSPVPPAFHQKLNDLLRAYYFTGGMPEAVRHFARTKNLEEVRKIQLDMLKAFVFDFAKHASQSDIVKLTRVWESIPRHLAKDNKKFILQAVHKSARARDYENALVWLEDTGLIHRCYATSTGKLPLKGYADRSCYKVYCLDVGLLGAMANAPTTLAAQKNRIFNEYEGALVENYVAQQLTASLGSDLYYWRSKGKTAELDFLCEFEGSIYPLEVKSGVNPKSKSLKSYDDQFKPSLLLRSSLLNLVHDGKICNIPLYAVSCLHKIIRLCRG
jgi:predicted AAA+ superfamily ATPase